MQLKGLEGSFCTSVTNDIKNFHFCNSGFLKSRSNELMVVNFICEMKPVSK